MATSELEKNMDCRNIFDKAGLALVRIVVFPILAQAYHNETTPKTPEMFSAVSRFTTAMLVMGICLNSVSILLGARPRLMVS